jgi:hypothetical protein
LALFILSFYISEVQAGRRAFLVGISEYRPLPTLRNPSWDIDAVKLKLEQVGFRTTVVNSGSQTTRSSLTKNWSAFLKSVEKEDEVVVYYSGHGVDIRGQNFLVPSDSPLMQDLAGETDLLNYLIPFTKLMDDLDDRQVTIQVWVLDSCRENPFSADGRSVGSPTGLAQMLSKTKNGLFIFYAAGYGQVARDRLPTDGPDVRSSPYTRTFIGAFDDFKNRPAPEFARALRNRVEELVSPHPQNPQYTDGVSWDWCFGVCAPQEVRVVLQRSAGAKPQQISGPATKAVARAESLVQAAPGVPLNAVFLAKRSAKNCADGTFSNNYPFGCPLAKFLAHARGSYSQLIGRTLIAQTGVNIRKQVPVVQQSGNAQFSCKVGEVEVGQAITLKSVVAVEYLSDEFYWGLLPGPPRACG